MYYHYVCMYYIGSGYWPSHPVSCVFNSIFHLYLAFFWIPTLLIVHNPTGTIFWLPSLPFCPWYFLLDDKVCRSRLWVPPGYRADMVECCSPNSDHPTGTLQCLRLCSVYEIWGQQVCSRAWANITRTPDNLEWVKYISAGIHKYLWKLAFLTPNVYSPLQCFDWHVHQCL